MSDFLKVYCGPSTHKEIAMKIVIWLILIGVMFLSPIQFTTTQEKQISDSVYLVIWNPVENKIAFADYNGTISVWDLTTDQVLWTFNEQRRPEHIPGVPQGYITGLQWNTDGILLAASSSRESSISTTITIWNTHTGQLVQTLEEPPGGSLTLDWIPNTPHLLTGMDGAVVPAVRLWDTTTGSLVDTYDISAANFSRSPTNNLLAVIPSYWVDLRDPTTLELFAQLRLETDYEQGYMVSAVAWSSDSAQVATGYLNGKVRIWEVGTSEIVREFQANEQVFENLGVPTSTVKEVAFSLDGTSLWSVSADGTLRQWGLQDGRLIVDQSLNKAIFAAAWSPYQARLALGVAPDDQPDTMGTPIGDELHSSPGLQVLVPITSIEQIRLTALACMDTQQQQELGIATLTSARLPGLVAKLHAFPITLKSTACFADILALVDALNTSTRGTIH